MRKRAEVRISRTRLRRVTITLITLSVLTILVASMSASANTVYSPVSFSNQANFTWIATETDPNGTTATYFPGGPGGLVTLGGIPFNILSNAAGFQAWNGYVASSGGNGTVSISMPVGVYGVTDVYTLINTYWGAPGVSYTALVFTGSGGTTYTDNLVGDSDIRNWCCGGTINGTSTINVFSESSSPINGSPGYLDMQHIVLPAAFATQTLVSIQLIDSGATGVQRTILDGVTVVSPLATRVFVDVKPQGCPNPFNMGAMGVLPVAILGAATFDVTTVDPSSVKLQGVSPMRSDLEDVATPFTGALANANSCTTAGPDGFNDLVLFFDDQAVSGALGQVTNGQVLVLTLTGNLLKQFGGTPITGQDIVVIEQ